ncbi:MAG TPA: ABC transporter ATP-binding protein [Acidimicrobiia bacterium]|jgi:branched-chain amino acid transport system ATP-binding protein|nr:ABC transporter ATP-binding protein [Acidimicrobiia bacterium]
MLELRNVSTGYGRLPVLFGINLRVDSGEMVGVLGPNGAGKSTLMKTILGLLPCRQGGIAFRGRKVSHEPAHARFTAGISLCPEGRRVFKNLSVRENLLAGAFGQDKTVVGEQLEAVYSIFPRLDERKDQRAGSLSGGEQQMLAISRALMSRPRLLLVDELSMGLAPLVVEELLDTLRQLCNRGLSVIVVDQFASRLVGRADRAELLEKGRIVFSGSVDAAERHMDETYLSDEMVAAAAKGV